MTANIITVSQLQEMLKNGENIQLIDVRTVEKHQAFNIGGQLIPLEELGERLDELDPNRLLVTYCTSGGRSMRALHFLQAAGFTAVKSLEGGVSAWRLNDCETNFSNS
jgi:adenylyltransferase/sulfurtransferase